MDAATIGLIAFGAVLFLLAMRVPIAPHRWCFRIPSI